MSRRSAANRFIASLLAVVFVAAGSGAPGTAGAGEVEIPRQAGLTPAAEEVLAGFESQAAAILARSREQMMQLRARTVARLQSLLTERMQAADLDGALAIREMIRSLEKTPSGLLTATGTWVLSAPPAIPGSAVVPRPPEIVIVKADPGEMSAYSKRLGERFYFQVRGDAQTGSLWGTDLYTHDSTLARAAVHAGALAAGEEGVVVVTMLKGPEWYSGSYRNGVTSGDWNNAGGYYSAYRIERAPPANYVAEGTTLNFAPVWEEPRIAPVLPDPGTLQTYYNRIGESFLFEITGADDGTVWGTDCYTYDSDLSAAAVHAGVVGRDAHKVVRVTIEKGVRQYVGSTRNGVTSQDWDNSGGQYTAFRLEAMDQPAIGYGQPHAHGSLWIDVSPTPIPLGTMGPSPPSATTPLPPIPLPDPGNLLAYRGLNGREFYFRVTGRPAAEFAIWGTDVYTDDSYLAIAAVHAGALRVGETGLLKVTILPGRDSYQGSVRNGVRSESYSVFEGSYRIERSDLPVEAGTIRLGDAATVEGATVTVNGGTLTLNRDTLRDPPGATLALRGLATWSAAAASDGRVTAIDGDTDMLSPAPAPGGTYYLKITGRTDGPLWGSGVYTSDSSVATAAVHAGILKPGQNGVVKVMMAPGQTHYDGSTRHGVMSSEYRGWDSSFQVAPDDRDR